jgi:concanavalin A-like lectin/glucanase superfamily protein
VVAHWPLCESWGGSVAVSRKDFHGSRHLTDSNTVTQGAGKVYPSAAQFTAANNESLSVASDSALQPGTADWWLAAWVWLDDLANYRSLVAKADGTTQEYRLEYWLGTGKFRFEAFGGTAEDTTPTAGAWYFLFAHCLGAGGAGAMGLSVNGGAATTGTPGASATGSAALRVGSDDWTFSYHNGRVQGVTYGKLPAGMLTADLRAEIRDRLYNAGAGRAYPF